jgi:dTDP-4-dehydrorhamnose 3,5-epimerase
MKITPLTLAGAYEITFEPRCDHRGYFTRVYSEDFFRQHGLQTSWVQENQSLTKTIHTIRGLHFQRPPFAETKFIRVVSGAIWDVMVDLRRSSPTYGQWVAVEIAAEKHNAVYIPRGFAHGFCSLTDNVVLVYKVDAPYAPEAEGGVRWDDPMLKIDWPTRHPILSARDSSLPTLSDFQTPFE